MEEGKHILVDTRAADLPINFHRLRGRIVNVRALNSRQLSL